MIIIVPLYLISKLWPFDIFSSKNSCTPHNSVTSLDIFMKLYRNAFQFKIMCHIHLRLLSAPE